MIANVIVRSKSFRVALLGGVLLLINSNGFANAQSCSLASPVSWALGASGSWAAPTNWSSDAVPNNPTTNVCITDGLSAVTLNQNASVGSLQLAGGNTVSTLPGFSFTIAGPQFVNEGDFEVNAGSSSNSIFSIAKDVEITNPSAFDGFITLNSTGAGSAFVRGAGHTLTLDPFATIQGSGAIGDDGLKVNLTGTIDANQTGKALSLNAGNGGVANHEGRILADNGGVLFLYNTITNNPGSLGGTIAANSGGTVNVAGTIVGSAIGGFGGTIQTYGSATLDGVTLNSIYTAGPGTVTTVKHALLFGSQVTNIPPTFQISGTLNVVSNGGQNTIVNVDNATFGNGPFFGFTPTVALSSTDGNGAAYIRGGSANTLTNDVVIEGAGFIGDDGLNLVNNGTLLANSASGSPRRRFRRRLVRQQWRSHGHRGFDA